MRMRGLCCRPMSVCPSVCLSDTFGYCIQTAGYVVKLLSRPGNSIILVFLTRALVPISRETPSEGRKMHGGGKNCDFRLKSLFISETVQDRPMIAVKC